MMIYPEMVNEGKGGSCFRTQKGFSQGCLKPGSPRGEVSWLMT